MFSCRAASLTLYVPPVATPRRSTACAKTLQMRHIMSNRTAWLVTITIGFIIFMHKWFMMTASETIVFAVTFSLCMYFYFRK